MKGSRFILFMALVFLLSWNSQVFSLKEETHQAINEDIAQDTAANFSLNIYLKNNLGFNAGDKEIFIGVDAKGIFAKNRIFEWIGYGGEQEDRPGAILDYLLNRPTRSVNHFHNPFASNWDDSGLDDIFGFYTGQSSVLWAQNNNQNIGGNWSWQNVRDYYYIALTSTTDSERQENYAKTFRGVGQLMHLVHDASVPEHVRNDAHVLDAYEARVEKLRNDPNFDIFWSGLIANPITFDEAILNMPLTNPSASIPIARIIDTDLYDGSNPNVTTTVQGVPQYIGLSEYTNVNFLSRDTMFTNDLSTDDRHYFPFPNSASAVLWLDPSNNRDYLKKTGNGDTVNHLAVASFLYNYRLNYFPQFNSALPVGLDSKCYDDYAQKLIPRAVGYSAGLLNYFFRGKMGIVHLPPDTFKIANLSDEDMEGNLSSFKLYYDDTNDNRFEIPLEFYDASGTQYTDPNTVLVITAQATSAFKVKLTGIPLDPKIPGEYMLVFKGKLGNEGAVPYDTDYAVAAQIIRPRINILQTGTDEFQIVNLSDGDMEGNLGSFRLFYDDTNDVQQEVQLDFYDENGNPLTNPDTIHTIAAQTKSTFKVKLNSLPQDPKALGEFLLTFKGRIENEGNAPYDDDYAYTEQEITPHFLTHMEVNGQWDIYEYDLLGNRIYNVTGELQRGVSHYHAIPNPVNPDLVVFQSDISCPENDPQPWTVCSRILTKSSGELEVAEWIRVPWWSNDGEIIYGVDGGYYDLSTEMFEPTSQWAVDGGLGVCGFVTAQSPSFSSDESMLAAEMFNPLYNPYRVDIVIYEPGLTINNPPTPTDIIDMNSFSLATTDYLNICNDYIDDEIYFDITPDFHPSDYRIVFTSNAGGLYNVYHTDFTSRDIQQLTTAFSGDIGYYEPAWSPDGQLILLVGDLQGEVPQIYTIPEAGGTLNQITEDEKPHYYPQWMNYLGQ